MDRDTYQSQYYSKVIITCERVDEDVENLLIWDELIGLDDIHEVAAFPPARLA